MSDRVPRIRLFSSDRHVTALAEAIRHNEFMQGAALEEFADRLKSLSNKRYCLLTANGFSSLFLAIQARGWRELRIAVPAASTCFAMTNAIRSSGNIPVYVDNDAETAGMCLDSVTQLYKRGDLQAAILPTHFGLMQSLQPLQDCGIPFIEDDAQSAMSVARYGTSADVAILSFYPTKNLNGVDGGAILTNDPDIYERARDLVYYGEQAKDDDNGRFNFRMSNLHAAFANVSLDSLDENIGSLEDVTSAYDAVLSQYPKVGRLGSRHAVPACLSKYVLCFPHREAADGFRIAMEKRSIGVSTELCMLPADAGPDFERAKHLAKTTVSIPFRETLTDDETEEVVNAMGTVLAGV